MLLNDLLVKILEAVADEIDPNWLILFQFVSKDWRQSILYGSQKLRINYIHASYLSIKCDTTIVKLASESSRVAKWICENMKHLILPHRNGFFDLILLTHDERFLQEKWDNCVDFRSRTLINFGPIFNMLMKNKKIQSWILKKFYALIISQCDEEMIFKSIINNCRWDMLDMVQSCNISDEFLRNFFYSHMNNLDDFKQIVRLCFQQMNGVAIRVAFSCIDLDKVLSNLSHYDIRCGCWRSMNLELIQFCYDRKVFPGETIWRICDIDDKFLNNVRYVKQLIQWLFFDQRFHMDSTDDEEIVLFWISMIEIQNLFHKHSITLDQSHKGSLWLLELAKEKQTFNLGDNFGYDSIKTIWKTIVKTGNVSIMNWVKKNGSKFGNFGNIPYHWIDDYGWRLSLSDVGSAEMFDYIKQQSDSNIITTLYFGYDSRFNNSSINELLNHLIDRNLLNQTRILKFGNGTSDLRQLFLQTHCPRFWDLLLKESKQFVNVDFPKDCLNSAYVQLFFEEFQRLTPLHLDWLNGLKDFDVVTLLIGFYLNNMVFEYDYVMKNLPQDHPERLREIEWRTNDQHLKGWIKLYYQLNYSFINQ